MSSSLQGEQAPSTAGPQSAGLQVGSSTSSPVSLAESCRCSDPRILVVDPEGRPSQQAQDGQGDLMLGVCAALQAGVTLTHHEGLFQARTDQPRHLRHRIISAMLLSPDDSTRWKILSRPLLTQDSASNFAAPWLEERRPVTLHHHGRAEGDFIEVM